MREGDIIMSKYYVLYHRLDRNDSSRSKADGVSKFLPNDELIFKVPLEEKEKVYQVIKDKMINAMNLSIPLQVDGGFGKSWYDCK